MSRKHDAVLRRRLGQSAKKLRFEPGRESEKEDRLYIIKDLNRAGLRVKKIVKVS